MCAEQGSRCSFSSSDCRHGLPRAGQRGGVSPLPCWPRSLQRTPGHHWLTGHQGTLLAHGHTVGHQDSHVVLCRAPIQHSAPSLYWCMRLLLPRCGTLRLSSLNLLSAQLFSLPRSISAGLLQLDLSLIANYCLLLKFLCAFLNHSLYYLLVAFHRSYLT